MMSSDFNAVLLAGGRSSRMGVHKSALLVGGQPLWRRQLGTLRAAGANAIAVAGPVHEPYAIPGITVLQDDRSIQRWIRACENAGLIRPRTLAAAEIPLFANLNSPADARSHGFA
jgi:molybdopterin-guanine dinucleotide biosynthesis protein A